MRVKHKKWADPLIAAHPEMMVDEPTKFKGQWQSRFSKAQPLHLEVGMGKGQFIIGMAKAHPEINFIGLEIQRTVAAIALKKALEEELPNLHRGLLRRRCRKGTRQDGSESRAGAHRDLARGPQGHARRRRHPDGARRHDLPRGRRSPRHGQVLRIGRRRAGDRLQGPHDQGQRLYGQGGYSSLL